MSRGKVAALRFAWTVLATLVFYLCAIDGAAAAASSLIVSYVEGRVVDHGALSRRLHAFAQEFGANPDAPRVLILHEIGRPNRKVVIEWWADPAAAAQSAAKLDAATAPDLQAPLDRRDNKALTPLLEALPPGGLFHVLMHVDVVPAGSDAAAKALVDLRSAVLAAPGGLGFEAAVQTDRPNHFAVHEIWSDRNKYEAYSAGPAAVRFRKQLAPIKGAPYDDRFYTVDDDLKK